MPDIDHVIMVLGIYYVIRVLDIDHVIMAG